MHSIIQILKEKNVLDKKGPKYSTIESLRIRDIVDIAIEISENTKSNHKPANNPLFSHAASLGLGGSSIDCSYVNCRIERIRNLSRFALMYSDKVYVDNFFDGYKDLDSNEDLTLAKQNFTDDLMVINEISSLIEKGYVELFSTGKDICFSCQARQFIGDSAAKKLDRAYRKLKSDFLNEMSVKVELGYEGLDFICEGQAPYFDHEMVSATRNVPEALIKRPSILKQIEKGNSVSISKALIKDLGLNEEYAHRIVSNSIFGLATSSCLSTTFLTDNDLHIKFLNSLNSNYEVSRRNLIAEKYLTTMVPFLEEIELKNLLKIRYREEEAFLLFRQALNKSIDEFRSLHEGFTENHAQSIYADIIAPSLALLNTKVKKAKKDLISNAYQTVTGIVGVISFGLLTGLVSSNISDIMKLLGLLKFSDFIKDTMALSDYEKNIKSDQYYFLWKIKNAR